MSETIRWLKISAASVLFGCVPFPVFAQAPVALAPEASQFDFWLGDWKTEMSSTPNFSVKRTGKDKVRSLLKGRLIEEVFTRDGDGEKFQRGYLTYLVRDKKWQHMIYDAKWGEYRFLGGKEGEHIVLETAPEDTRPMKHRETFSNITSNSFNYTWESSKDKGKTWFPVWRVQYERSPTNKTAESK